MYLVSFIIGVLKDTWSYIQNGNWCIACPLCDPLVWFGLVWFGLFVHPFTHICNTGHVNYGLQFTTHLVIYRHLRNTI
jgi:hypothetical protein